MVVENGIVISSSIIRILFQLILVYFLSSFPSEGGVIKREASTNATSPIVYLTVSSVVPSSGRDRLLELNWEDVPPDMLDRQEASVELLASDPRLGDGEPLAVARVTSKGFYRTSVQFPRPTFHPENLSDSCLGFWIALKRRDEVVASSCLRGHPHWMHESRQRIGNLSLMDIMIPGTHNAGSYAPFDPNDDSIFNRYVYTQEESIWTQLCYGVRHLDLRVAFHQGVGRERFWITHSSFRTPTTLRTVLQQVQGFVRATREIVVLDFHRFVTGFNNRRTARQRHTDLVQLIEEHLGDVMVPVEMTSWATLGQLWDANKRAYVGYADELTRRQNSRLFPAIRQLWGDVDTVRDLGTFLDRKMCDRRNRLTSAMAQLTPKTTGVIFDTYGGLRKMADQVNREVTKWYRSNWTDCSNIVATDFFLGNGVIEVAIEANKHRLSRLL